MNKQRREKIKECRSMIEDVRDMLDDIQSDEQMAFDNLPENLQYSLRGEEMEEAIDYIGNAVDYLDNAVDELDGII